ncbi:alpha/beta fold hydrolase [Mycobacterium sp. NPDC006124]|uniref:alpha/beta fold hydrolase n=1 Tax=Mycobacterium sp. NPDC006124 TaxID=3156729 RepID=UPI0033B64B0E
MTLQIVSACASGHGGPSPAGEKEPVVHDIAPPFQGAVGNLSPDFRDDGPGSLVSVTPMAGATELEDIDATYMRVVYRSTYGMDDSPTEVSGVVAIPAGQAPKGGWPVISFGHGTTGVLNKCAPSNFGTLPGNSAMMAAMISNGFAVTSTDYQGLGVPGYYHPFLDAKTFGNNMIDAVRAAERVGADVSNKWIAFGHSLGGMAAWAAADRAGVYGKGLNLLGTLSMAPAADMAGLADKAQDGTLTEEQRVAMVFVLQSLSWSHPDLDLNRYRSGYTAEHWDEILDCLPANLDDIGQTRSGMLASDLKPATQADTDRLRALLAAYALPQNRPTGPMRVVYGTEDTLVDAAWTEGALKKVCELGADVEIDKRIGQGHGDLDSAFGLPWMRDVLGGQTVVSSCLGSS